MKVLVGISGSIGLLGIPAHLISLQVEAKVEELRILMTPTASRFLSPQTLEALLRLPVYVDPWTDGRPMRSPPELVKDIDLYLIAPASATTLSRCANGSGETLLSYCYLCHPGAAAFAPTMAAAAWKHPAVLRNLARLQEDGACILPAGPSYSASTGTFERNGMCPYPEMWPLLKTYMEERQNVAAAITERDAGSP
jgi:phosphopantothenoylcysteine decarboxylase/phosphopantothenate--cysteine ligase